MIDESLFKHLTYYSCQCTPYHIPPYQGNCEIDISYCQDYLPANIGLYVEVDIHVIV